MAGLSLSEGLQCVTAVKLCPLIMMLEGCFLVEVVQFMTAQRLEIIVEANS